MRQFDVIPTGGINGGPLIASVNDALYASFKAALLGERNGLITDGPDDLRFVKAQQNRLSPKNPNPKAGIWVHQSGLQLDCPEWGGPFYSPGYCAKIKFIPPIRRVCLDELIGRFKEEFGIENSQYRPPTLARTYTVHNLSYVPADEVLEVLNLNVFETEFDAKLKVIVTARGEALPFP